MVKIPPPPPSRTTAPRHTTLTPADKLVRIYDPTWLGPSTYNHYGPRARFDHHVVAVPPADDPTHGIYYAAPTLQDCVVEVFGDAGVISLARHRRLLAAVVHPAYENLSPR